LSITFIGNINAFIMTNKNLVVCFIVCLCGLHQVYAQRIFTINTHWTKVRFPNMAFIPNSFSSKTDAFPLYGLSFSYAWPAPNRRLEHQILVKGITYRRDDYTTPLPALGGQTYTRNADAGIRYGLVFSIYQQKNLRFALSPYIESTILGENLIHKNSNLFPVRYWRFNQSIGINPSIRHHHGRFYEDFSLPIQLCSFALLQKHIVNPVLTFDQQRYRASDFYFLRHLAILQLGFGWELGNKTKKNHQKAKLKR
jgi:hypothetical protein